LRSFPHTIADWTDSPVLDVVKRSRDYLSSALSRGTLVNGSLRLPLLVLDLSHLPSDLDTSFPHVVDDFPVLVPLQTFLRTKMSNTLPPKNSFYTPPLTFYHDPTTDLPSVGVLLSSLPSICAPSFPSTFIVLRFFLFLCELLPQVYSLTSRNERSLSKNCHAELMLRILKATVDVVDSVSFRRTYFLLLHLLIISLRRTSRVSFSALLLSTSQNLL